MIRRDFLKISGTAGVSALLIPGFPMMTGCAQNMNQLEQIFLDPSSSARPGNMWFWMNGHVTREGITLDLEAMQRIGVGAVFNFDAGTGIPKGPLQYLSPEWFEMKSFALQECQRLGIDFCMHNCPGWSSSGGPWITPDRSMKTLVWSEIQVDLEDPEDVVLLPVPEHKLDYYQDVCVLAFPSLPAETPPFANWERRTNKEFNRGLEPIDSTLPVINPEHIIMVTAGMDGEGQFDLQALKDQVKDSGFQSLTIQRFGYTSLGTENRSAPETGVGLECDKYDPQAVAFHFDKMITPLLPYLEPLAQKGMMALEIDSWEVGMQNWTGGFEKEFERRNGYDLLPYLPAMTGKVVGGADLTDRLLWDVRRTQADMLADNYYGQMAALCHAHGIHAYFEPYDRGPMEELQIGIRGDLSMGEYWFGLSTIFQNNLTMRRTCKLASSVAHISGQRIVGVEGLTAEPEAARWQEYAFAMKPVCDKMFTMGINRILVHRNAHQPHPTAVPGMTMGPWGIHFDRTNCLWEANKGWITYLTRCQSMLQHGLFVADFAYFTGEDPGVYTEVLPIDLHPEPLAGYDYDLIDAEMLSRNAKIVNGRMVLPDGMSYRVLVLQDRQQISLELLRTIKSFLEQGLIVIGQKPVDAPGLRSQRPENIAEFKTLVDGMWGTTELTDRSIGMGRLFWGQPLTEILPSIGLPPDCTITSQSGDVPIHYIHRQAEDGDYYFLSNQRRTDEDLVVSFRIKDKQPELWDAVTGEMALASCFETTDNGTRVAIHLPPYGSVFVVFRNAIKQHGLHSVKKDGVDVLTSKPFPMPALPSSPNHNNLVNHFTLSFWAKPENNIMLSTAALYEGVKHPWTDYYAIYPPGGNFLYGEGHATCGVTVGRNGVAVWENGNGFPEFNFSAPGALSGWTHIGIVYQEGVPTIYIDGKKVGRGVKKFEQIHPSVGDHFENIFWISRYYNGDLSPIELIPRAMNSEEMVIVSAQPIPPIPGQLPAVTQLAHPKKVNLLFWEPGKYLLEDQKGDSRDVIIKDLLTFPVTGQWDVQFPADRGAPDHIRLDKLISLQEHPDDGVKYFSGTARYRIEFIITPDELKKERKLYMDLGRVEVIAEVWVNDQPLGNYWTRPYLVDVSRVIRGGVNTLEVHVTNQWVNRLIGDAQQPDLYEYTTVDRPSPFQPLIEGAIKELPQWYLEGAPKPDDGRVTFSTWKHHRQESPLLDAGLIGPVVIREAQEYSLE
ncbi:MAG: hypothetical protein KDC57_14530 [Saprospiraceae bacterium]|nr:hypothetical protein [Saprospiraceae bacterium]